MERRLKQVSYNIIMVSPPDGHHVRGSAELRQNSYSRAALSSRVDADKN